MANRTSFTLDGRTITRPVPKTDRMPNAAGPYNEEGRIAWNDLRDALNALRTACSGAGIDVSGVVVPAALNES